MRSTDLEWDTAALDLGGPRAPEMKRLVVLVAVGRAVERLLAGDRKDRLKMTALTATRWAPIRTKGPLDNSRSSRYKPGRTCGPFSAALMMQVPHHRRGEYSAREL
jgi:hypothetical protein